MPSTVRPGVRAALATVALASLGATVAACTVPTGPLPPPVTSATSSTAGPTTTATPTTAPTTATTTAPASGAGPRALADSQIPLELASFPRPAAQACAGHQQRLVRNGESIAAAVTSAPANTTIAVEPGTYTEQPGEPTALEWSTAGLCLVSTGPGRVVIQAASSQSYGLGLTGDDTVISGIDLRGFASGIGLNATGGATQRRVTIEHISISGFTGAQREGIVAYGDNRQSPGTPPTVDGLLLDDVTVTGADLGVSCNGGPCAHWWIEGSNVTGRTTSEDSGADAIAIEEGRQIAVVNTTVAGVAADGIDTKADDVVVTGARVLGVKRNGVKLWRGGEVIDTVLDGTNADAALVGDRAGRYRYLRTTVTHHGDPGAEQYVGTWGYDNPGEPGMQLEIIGCTFRDNATGGFFAPASARIWFEGNRFADVGSKLLELSDGTQWMTTPSDVAALEARGDGRGNVVGS